ncbi:MAG: LacI family transcriptional regulator [Chloroflexi bacterium]|nr:LacI family transcriptional regulator [Chloroflexota bacterium]
MPVSLKDVARKAGVSVATASRALADHPRISENTKARVRQAARELGYTPSAVARSLVKRETHTLGVITTSVTDPYAAQVVKAVEVAAEAAGYHLLLVASHGVPSREVKALRMLYERRVDGIVIISARGMDAYEDVLSHLTVPVVLVNGRVPHPAVRSVSANNRQGASLAVEYLLDAGYTRIAYIGGPTQGQSARHRVQGYVQALQAAGLVPSPDVIFPGQGTAEDGRRALRHMMSLRPKPEAVLCYNDLTAFGVLAEAWAMGVRVPDDLAVIGFDNLPFSELTAPPLTTVAQPTEEMGQTAVSLLLRQRRGEEVQDVVFDCTLVERASVRR